MREIILFGFFLISFTQHDTMQIHSYSRELHDFIFFFLSIPLRLCATVSLSCLLSLDTLDILRCDLFGTILQRPLEANVFYEQSFGSLQQRSVRKTELPYDSISTLGLYLTLESLTAGLLLDGVGCFFPCKVLLVSCRVFLRH